MSALPASACETTMEAARIIGAAFGVLARHWKLPEADRGPVEPGFTSVAQLFATDGFLDAMLARQQQATPGLDAKGAAAFFVTEYSNLLGIIAAVPFPVARPRVRTSSARNCALRRHTSRRASRRACGCGFCALPA